MKYRIHIAPLLYAFLLYLLLWLPLTGYAENPATSPPSENSWQVLEPGLEFGIFRTPASPKNAGIHVLRIDPTYFEFRLLNASATTAKQLLTAKEWCRQYDLVAAINASMYQEDYLASVSLMQTAGHINNPRLSKDKSILAFDRRTPNVPLLKIVDRQCESFEEWKPHYTTFIQNIRMISCYGKNVWRQQPQKWSTAAIAVDTEGRGLFIHARFPYSTHDLINVLLELPLNISRAMYAEGGHEAQLYIHSGLYEYEVVGSYGPVFSGHTDNRNAAPIPNVVAIARRKK